MFGLLVLALLGQICLGKEFQLDERSRHLIYREKNRNVFAEKHIEYQLNNPVTQRQRECFDKLRPNQSIDFVIDLSPSPSNDDVDKRCASSPVGQFLELIYSESTSVIPRSPSKSYFDAIQAFIESVTFDVKPECTSCEFYNHENGKKFYLRGRHIEDIEMKHGVIGDFNDLARNLKTMWPAPTNSKPEDSKMSPILKNNLGRMVKLTLWNRDNGLPTVLDDSKRSESVYTIVISDGSSGAKLSDLTNNLGRTSVIDIGEHRFVSRMSWDELKSVINVLTLTSPQQLPLMVNTIRTLACWQITK